MPVFFLDNDQGTKILPNYLRAMGIKVVCLQDEFDRETPDSHWLPICGGKGYLIISSDKGIECDPANLQALIESKAKIVLLEDNDSPAVGWASALIVCRHWLAQLMTACEGTCVVTLRNKANLYHSPRQPLVRADAVERVG